ncbi:MAG: haloacid dehalogenase-like hydrolase [Lachnospiraceae bacterium]|nr:haloacid dehalogenase-like hydrolase [Lachnospiraceae bacterium]
MDQQGNRVLAICYDFDKTLSPTDMQAQGYIQSVGYDVAEFWKKTDRLAEDNDMDKNLAYMYVMMDEARGRLIFNREKLQEYGSKVQLFPGVAEWFGRLNAYGKERGISVEHYIISSGLKEMIDGTEIAQKGVFKKVYASSFFYDDRGMAVWPAQVVNFTNKTQFLFRIVKGVLDVNDDGVNNFFRPEDQRVPFRNMVYIGDSDTDIPCMKLVNTNGGHSIGVYDPVKQNKDRVYQMLRESRIRYFAPADYTEGSELDRLLKAIIDKTNSYEVLEGKHVRDVHEVSGEGAV